MKKLLIILGLISTFTGISIDKKDVIDVFNSTEYSQEVKENAANYVAEQLEIQYEKMVNEEAPFGKHFCNP